MACRWQILLGVTVAGFVAAVPAVFSSHRQTHHRNFRVVEEGVLYRSGQLSPTALDQVLHDYDIKTVVTLRTVRDKSRPFPDDWERDVCAARGAKHVRIVPEVWGPDEKGEVPADKVVKAFLSVMDDPANHPVLVHCFAGIHRTGHMCAVFRMDYQGWTADQVIAEMEVYGYDPEELHEHVSNYLRAYRPRKRIQPGVYPGSGQN